MYIDVKIEEDKTINFVAVTANFAAGDYRLRRWLGRHHPRRPARPPRLPHTQGAEEAESAPSGRRKLTAAIIQIRAALKTKGSSAAQTQTHSRFP